MKQLKISFFFLCSVIMLQSCGSGDTKETTATTDSSTNNSTVTADSSRTSSDNSGDMNSNHANTNMDSGKTTGQNNDQMASQVDKDAQEFAMKAASGGMMEVELGKTAQQNGESQAVKDYGKMLEQDHTAAGNELKGIATSKNIKIPDAMMPMHKMHVDDLSKKTGADFDKAYVSMMIEDHNKDIADYKKASANLKDADLKAFASKTLPVLEKHLAAAKKLKK